MGDGECISQTTKATDSAAAAPKPASTRGSSHPRDGPSMMEAISASIPPRERTAPSRSNLPGCGSRLSGTSTKPASNATAATGTLTKKTEPQSNQRSSRPPTRGPSPMPTAARPAQMPIALPRSSRGNTAVIVERVAGMIIAAPRPITDRHRISWSAVPERPASRLAVPKTTMPACSIRLRPMRSASVPAVSRNAPKTSR